MPSPPRALALATRHVNASTRRSVSEDELLDTLRTGRVQEAFAHHVHAFIDETDLATLADLVIEGSATYGQLAALADRLLPRHHPTRTWLHDRRDL